MRKVCLVVNPANQRAIRCYRACGFLEKGRQRQQVWLGEQYVDMLHMGILRDEWRQLMRG
jgi:RimJ/RimL family protein N-acetyltransferase